MDGFLMRLLELNKVKVSCIERIKNSTVCAKNPITFDSDL